MLKILKQKVLKSCLLFFAVVFVVTPLASSADDVIDVVFDPASGIHETNILPGKVMMLKFLVSSKSDEDQDLMLQMNLPRGSWILPDDNLEEKIIVQLRRSSDPAGTYLNMPNGSTSQILGTINNNTFEFDTLPHRKSENYELTFTFDPLAGNEYQGKESYFDLEVGVDAEDAGGDGGDGGAPAGGAPLLAGFAGFNAGSTGEVGGAETPTEQELGNNEIKKVEGTETCSEWPFWVWILMLVIFGLLFNYSSYRKIKENKIRWFAPAFWTAAILTVWYYFEKCRFYPWYPHVLIIVSLVSYFLYLYWIRKINKK